MLTTITTITITIVTMTFTITKKYIMTIITMVE